MVTALPLEFLLIMPTSFTLLHTVRFGETDAAGIIHFSAPTHWMEEAETAFFEHIDYPLYDRNASPPNGFPRVHVETQFTAPIRFGDKVLIEMRPELSRNASITYHFKFHRIRNGVSSEAATGKMIVVYVEIRNKDHGFEAALLPVSLREKIESFLISE